MCIRDSIQTQAAFKTYWAKRLEEDPDIDPYNDLFCDLLEENAQAHPKYQGDCGDWLNWTVPDTDCNLPIFSSGWGDGYYPVYFGYDAKGKVCAVYVLSLIHILCPWFCLTRSSFRTGMGVTPDATKNGPRPFLTIIPKPSVVVMP